MIKQLASLIVCLLISTSTSIGATAPGQPTDGPGGSSAGYTEMLIRHLGEGDNECWIFIPKTQERTTLPVILFCHGWSAMNPNDYGAWIRHLTLRGNIVIYPRYQASISTSMKVFTPNTISAFKEALKQLNNDKDARPDMERIAVVGHSMGGAIAPNIAASAKTERLPTIKCVCAVEPDYKVKGMERFQMPMADMNNIPPDTLVQVIVGDQDKLAGDDCAKTIFAGLKQVKDENKNYITLVSDSHGTPALNANHMAPVAMEQIVDEDNDPSNKSGTLRQRLAERQKSSDSSANPTLNTLDYYGTWKLLDALTDSAFYNKNRSYALGNTPDQRYMGTWSDGTKVRELIVRH